MTGHGQNTPPGQPSAPKGPEAWTQRDLELLHDMVRDYDRARWLRGQAKWWAVWLFGVPAAVVSIWEPLERLWRLFRRGIGI